MHLVMVKMNSFKLPYRVIALSETPVSAARQNRSMDGKNTSAGPEQQDVVMPAAEAASLRKELARLQEREKELQIRLDEVSNAKNSEQGRLRVAVATLDKATQLFNEQCHNYHHLIEMDVVKLAMEIAKRVVQREAKVSTDIILYTVRELLKRAENATTVQAKCHPEDIVTLESDNNFNAWRAKNSKKLSLEAESTISRGGCILETDLGIFDGQLESQLAEIEMNIFDQTATTEGNNQ